MSAHGEEQKPVSGWRVTLRRLLAPFSVIATVLYVGIWISEAYEYLHQEKKETPEARENGGSFLDSMQASVQRQLNQLKKVDPMALSGVYTRTLEQTDCTWLFQCTPIPQPHFRDWRDALQNFTLTQTPTRNTQLLYHPGWIIYIPTARTIKGTPHALLETVGAIRQAGGWAVAMFLSCTVIWVTLVWFAATEGDSGLMVYCMVIGSMLAISLMVSLVKVVSEFALEKVGSGLGLFVVVAAHSSALALLVGLPHIFKAPHEVKEATEVFKKV